MRRVRFAVREGFSKLSPDGGPLKVRAFGVRIGYWPCLQAPFIEIALGTKRYELWYGLPSYR
jgi:hypothetical protein